MRLIKETEQTADCAGCRHYRFHPEEPFPHVCQAMEYMGKQPASETVLNPEEGPCPLLESPGKAPS